MLTFNVNPSNTKFKLEPLTRFKAIDQTSIFNLFGVLENHSPIILRQSTAIISGYSNIQYMKTLLSCHHYVDILYPTVYRIQNAHILRCVVH
jgi:hypothetical protein